MHPDIALEGTAARTNTWGQAIGAAVPDWQQRPLPRPITLRGRAVHLEPLDPQRHARDLFQAYSAAPDGRDWTYMAQEPMQTEQDTLLHLQALAGHDGEQHWAVIDARRQQAIGTLALMRMDPDNGVIEVGHVTFSPALQRTAGATEAHALLMQHVFDDLGYRRCEWKCDALNAPSRRAAQRLGYRFEGVFRQLRVYKGRNRDTAWFALLDHEWPAQRARFERWLQPQNFDAQGRQLSRLQS